MAKPLEKRKCHVCGQRSLKRVKRPYERQVRHEGRPPVTIRIPDLEVIACTNPSCRPEHPDDTILEDDAAIGRITEETYRQLGLLTPGEIRSRREELGLSQQEVQELLGLGGNTLSRWETAHVYQSRALDRFLRVFFASGQVRDMLETGDFDHVHGTVVIQERPSSGADG
jgi:DNA-binding transcriptional regulator YiaG